MLENTFCSREEAVQVLGPALTILLRILRIFFSTWSCLSIWTVAEWGLISFWLKILTVVIIPECHCLSCSPCCGEQSGLDREWFLCTAAQIAWTFQRSLSTFKVRGKKLFTINWVPVVWEWDDISINSSVATHHKELILLKAVHTVSCLYNAWILWNYCRTITYSVIYSSRLWAPAVNKAWRKLPTPRAALLL